LYRLPDPFEADKKGGAWTMEEGVLRSSIQSVGDGLTGCYCGGMMNG
jgi:hypothetical protein